MSPLKLRLKPRELQRVRYLLGIKEPRVIRRNGDSRRPRHERAWAMCIELCGKTFRTDY
jgi:hypothetical protein